MRFVTPTSQNMFLTQRRRVAEYAEAVRGGFALRTDFIVTHKQGFISGGQPPDPRCGVPCRAAAIKLSAHSAPLRLCVKKPLQLLTTERTTKNEIIPIRKHPAQRGAFHPVPDLQGQLPRTARLRRCQRSRRFLRRCPLVGADGPQLARLGRGSLALRLPAHPQGDQVREEVGVMSWSWRMEVFVHWG